MPVSVQWDNAEQTIIRYDVDGRWGWEEFEDAMNEGVNMRTSVSQIVDVIVSLHSDAGLPPNLLTEFGRLFRVPLSNRGVILLSSTNRFATTVFNVFTTLYPKSRGRMFAVNTLEDARQFIREQQVARNIQT